MEESSPPRKTKTRITDTANPQIPVSTVAQPPTAEVPPEATEELTKLIQQLLMVTHELSFEYSTLECDEISECMLARKSKELFRVVKQLNELSKKFVTPSRTQYVS